MMTVCLGRHATCVSPTHRNAPPVGVAQIWWMTGSRSTKGMSVERSKIEGIEQRAGRRHTGNDTARGPEPLHTSPHPTNQDKRTGCSGAA
eukprot:359869-Chlamydomonas_euryale.AAC.27